MNGRRIEDYRDIVGTDVLAELFKESRPLRGKRILNINSTFTGGGVAEMLWSLIPLMNDLGIDMGWRVIHGTPDFFNITKKWHNALQGDRKTITEAEKEIYTSVNEIFASFTHILHDMVVIHDPQPLPLVKYYKKKQPWLWRCHIDISHPSPTAWDYLSSFILRYDRTVTTSEKFVRDDCPGEQALIAPAIDPLDIKNRQLPPERIDELLEENGIKTDKPIIAQVSRFDPWKDPHGVIKVFDLVKEAIDCRLVLLGSIAADDPQGQEVFSDLVEETKDRDDILLINKDSEVLVNAVQRTADVIIQKSTREGFGLTVTEALWKKTPVVASDVGGIPLQMKDGETGYLLPPKSYKKFAEKIVNIIQNPDKAKELGKSGKEYIRKNFLITRLMIDWIKQYQELLN